MKNSLEYKRAKQRLEARYGFYTHLVVFLAVNLLLITINLAKAEPIWFIYPLFGWGIGLFFHALSVFAGNRLSAERMIERRLRKEGF